MTTEKRDFYDLKPAERECPDCGSDCCDQHDAD